MEGLLSTSFRNVEFSPQDEQRIEEEHLKEEDHFLLPSNNVMIARPVRGLLQVRRILRSNIFRFIVICISFSLFLLSVRLYLMAKRTLRTPLQWSMNTAEPGIPLPWQWSVTSKGILESISVQEVKAKESRPIVAIIFYGRPETARVLDCYLQRNMAYNGGLLDEVIWLARFASGTEQEKKEASQWLDRKVAMVKNYRRVDMPVEHGYSSMYNVIEPGTLYFKIDDDILFFEDTTLSTMLDTKLQNPDALIIGANVVNQNLLSMKHQAHLGLFGKFMPNTLDNIQARYGPGQFTSWRTSAQPQWSETEQELLSPSDIVKAPHRWLRADNVKIGQTPLASFDYMEDIDAWRSPMSGEQAHATFLANLEKNELWRHKFYNFYHFGQRMGIQFILFDGSFIEKLKPIPQGDERFLSITAPMKLNMSVIVDGRGLAAHHAYRPQFRQGFLGSGFLERYQDFAESHICPGSK